MGGSPVSNLTLAVRKLLTGEIKGRSRKNVVESRTFADMLGQAIRRYQNRAIETAMSSRS